MKKRIAAALTALAIAAGIVLVAAEPAQAYSYWGCPEGVGCMWVNSGGGGSRIVVSVSNTGYNTCRLMPAGWNDVASSASGDFGGGWEMAVYKDSTCSNGSPWVRYFAGHSESYTGLLAYFNDITSSFAIIHP
jgi:hypothetical protein